MTIVMCPDTSDEKKWKIENDARTLREAEEIKVDKKRFKAAAAELKKQAKAAQRATMAVERGWVK